MKKVSLAKGSITTTVDWLAKSFTFVAPNNGRFLSISPITDTQYASNVRIEVDNFTISSATSLENQLNNLSNIQINPNPASEQVVIQYTNQQNKQPISLKCIDNSGRVIFTKSLIFNQYQNKIPVSVENLAEGLYSFVFQNNEGQIFVNKVMVQR